MQSTEIPACKLYCTNAMLPATGPKHAHLCAGVTHSRASGVIVRMHSAMLCCLTPAVLQGLALFRDDLWQCPQGFGQLLYAWYHHSCPQKRLCLKLSRGAAGVAVGPYNNEATWNLVPGGKTLHEWVVDPLYVRLQCTPLQHKTTVVLWSWQWLHAVGDTLVDCTCRTWQASCAEAE